MGGMADRDFDIVLFGATGFTGQLTADYLARTAPPGLRWALGGRNQGKLEAVRERLGLPDLELLQADSGDPASLADVAARTRVVITTVGPYLQYGEALVGACAEAGTDYVDLTGEPEFIDRMYLEHHQTAVRTGARLVHACGFDSVPHDLGALYTVRQLPSDAPINLRGVVRAGAMASSGTLHSALTQVGRPRQMKQASTARRRAEGRPAGGRRSRAVSGTPHRDPVLDYWLLPLPTVDPVIVARSGAALPEYGPDFRYSHYAGTKTIRYAAGGVLGLVALASAAQVPALSKFLRSKVTAGDGPDASKREKSWFTVDFVGEGGGGTVRTRVSGGDPGYGETAMMLAESALCLALDDNPVTAGQVTTAQAMGDHLLARVQAAGLRFETR
jgi:saccharopine dehydrogenase (NAD+, L-glutamate forming)